MSRSMKHVFRMAYCLGALIALGAFLSPAVEARETILLAGGSLLVLGLIGEVAHP